MKTSYLSGTNWKGIPIQFIGQKNLNENMAGFVVTPQTKAKISSLKRWQFVRYYFLFATTDFVGYVLCKATFGLSNRKYILLQRYLLFA